MQKPKEKEWTVWYGDGKLRASILRKRLNIFLGGLRFAFNPGTTLAYFVVSGAQNTRKTKDNALRYLYTMLVVKMRRKKRRGLGVLEGGTRRMEMSMGWGWLGMYKQKKARVD